VADEEQRLPLVCAAALKHRRVVALLLPATSRLEGVADWSVDGLLAHAEEQLAKARAGGWRAGGWRPLDCWRPVGVALAGRGRGFAGC
jgi:hypothetical protein